MRLSLQVHGHGNGTRGMRRVELQEGNVEAKLCEPGAKLLSKLIGSHTAGNHAPVSQERGDIGEIGGRAADLGTVGEQIPEDFADAYYGGRLRGHRRPDYNSGDNGIEEMDGLFETGSFC